VSWADYFQDAPQAGTFRLFGATGIDPHFFPLPVLLQQAAGAPNLPALPSVSFVDPNFGLFGIAQENDEHPPTDIQRGQAFVSLVVNALRNGPYWQDTVSSSVCACLSRSVRNCRMTSPFDFEGSPSLNTSITSAVPPAQDCTPK